eukprot:gnl/TRDRNA2_/TRDRNA2_174461_c0_seq2.p1 gnl/TRDRNA2_/TRDRNA2_174461_c0~~gnl/TRDRNA2_/TRDRNA2_174461_c0_seq2.p1  ORF type:complete len:436 (-),score=69.59 gnl/TRDRNA2_/TRDRNA2_174461_c0_seq2:528-1835(-)
MYMSPTNKLGIVRITGTHQFWKINLRGLSNVPMGAWGSGWNFKNRVYFAKNNGVGVYQVKVPSINVNTKIGKAVKAGDSTKTNKNDGMNCMNVDTPFPLPPEVIVTAPWDCSGKEASESNNPLQMLCTKEKGCDVKALGIATGRYSKLFHVKQSDPPYEKINACAINPVDSILYCAVGFGEKKAYLARIDRSDIAFLGELPSWWYSGTFDAEGVYYGSNGWKIYMIGGLDKLDGYAKPSETPTNFKQADSFKVKGPLHDLVAVNANLDGSGMKNYLMFMLERNALGIVRMSGGRASWEINLDGLTGTTKSAWGSGWNFKNELYFARNDCCGVYKIDVPSIDIITRTGRVVKAGSSPKNSENDGMNCMNVDSPFSTTTTTTTSFTGSDDCIKGYIKDTSCDCSDQVICRQCTVEEDCGGKGSVTSNDDGTACLCSD